MQEKVIVTERGAKVGYLRGGGCDYLVLTINLSGRPKHLRENTLKELKQLILDFLKEKKLSLKSQKSYNFSRFSNLARKRKEAKKAL